MRSWKRHGLQILYINQGDIYDNIRHNRGKVSITKKIFKFVHHKMEIFDLFPGNFLQNQGELALEQVQNFHSSVPFYKRFQFKEFKSKGHLPSQIGSSRIQVFNVFRKNFISCVCRREKHKKTLTVFLFVTCKMKIEIK